MFLNNRSEHSWKRKFNDEHFDSARTRKCTQNVAWSREEMRLLALHPSLEKPKPNGEKKIIIRSVYFLHENLVQWVPITLGIQWRCLTYLKISLLNSMFIGTHCINLTNTIWFKWFTSINSSVWHFKCNILNSLAYRFSK